MDSIPERLEYVGWFSTGLRFEKDRKKAPRHANALRKKAILTISMKFHTFLKYAHPRLRISISSSTRK